MDPAAKYFDEVLEAYGEMHSLERRASFWAMTAPKGASIKFYELFKAGVPPKEAAEQMSAMDA